MTDHHLALADARPHCYWLDRPELAPEAQPRLVGDVRADLAVVGGGYTGLWTALLAKERDPSRDVVLLEGNYVGWAASGRNGGFCAANLTHGLPNGAQRWPDELHELERLGRQNLDEIEKAVHRYGIDCDLDRTGWMDVATEAYQAEHLEEHAALARRYGNDAVVLDREQAQAELRSPTYLGAVWMTDALALVDPAKLAWGLKTACLQAGVRIHEHSPVERLDDDGPALRLATPFGSVTAEKVVLGTNAFPPLLRRIRQYVVPVYDYALMTEPLSSEQRESVGWEHKQGIEDLGNQFHYYRPTADGRILWGGYDAIYHYGNKVQPGLTQRPETFSKLADHFFTTFPQLEGLRFTHSWGGVIDTCSRFSVFFGTASRGRIAYAVGYTGLGVGATRFGAQVVLDLLAGERTERTELEFVRSKPVPFPPEPLRSGVINLTRWSYARADENDGRQNVWLRTLDRLGLGFQS
jgi:glycine/D-amino acid oxidase-like deaminating enzyme